jgi:hypothetical protein
MGPLRAPRRAGAWLVAALVPLGGCTGTIAEPSSGGPAGSGLPGAGATGGSSTSGGSSGGSASGGASAGGSSAGGSSSGGSSGGGSTGQIASPELEAVATQYFPGQTALASKSRLFRLTRTQLDLTTEYLLPEHYVGSAFASMPRDPLQTNYEYADNLAFSAANFTPFTDWVQGIVDRVRAAPESVIDCADAGASACLEEQAKAFVTRAFRGVVSEAELTRFANFFVASVNEVGLADATADLVDVTLTSQSYVFRKELQTDATERLLPAELAQNLTYTLADAPPAALGLSPLAVGAEALPQAELERLVDQVLATPEARAKLLRFFMAWLEVREPDELDLAPSVFPELTPEVATAIVEETQAFLTEMLGKALPSLRDVTESTQAFVSQPTAFLYGVSASSQPGLVALDPAQRLGIFSQPAVIASHSGPTTTRLVKRGVFFTRKIMCLPLGVPPDDVDTTLPVIDGATERQRIESVTTAPKCAGCHAFINPFGFMLENYDAIGRYRTLDAEQPIDASISVDFLDEGVFSADTPVDALRGFTRSWRFEQCFARQIFRFYMGRDEESSDDPSLRRMFVDFASSDKKDLLGMLRTLATSPSLSQRVEAP